MPGSPRQAAWYRALQPLGARKPQAAGCPAAKAPRYAGTHRRQVVLEQMLLQRLPQQLPIDQEVKRTGWVCNSSPRDGTGLTGTAEFAGLCILLVDVQASAM